MPKIPKNLMMKKLQLFLLMLIATVTVAQAQTYPTTYWSDVADTSWYNATQDEFTLSTAEALAGLSQLVAEGNTFEDKTIIIGANIDLDGNLWSPIGVAFDFPFSGSVEGEDFTISNLWINQPDTDLIALFGQTANASFFDINIDTANVIGKDNTSSLVASLFDNSVIENCSAINVTITGQYSSGGLVGGFLTNSSISNSYAIGDVTGTLQVGGFAGTGWDNSEVYECYSEGTVTGELLVGGLIGSFPFAFGGLSTIEDSYSRSSVVATVERAGGLLGGGDNALNIANSYSTGTVSAPVFAGGMIGLWGAIDVENLYFDTESSGMTEGVGGFGGPPATPDITGKTTAEMKTTEMADLLNAGNPDGPWSIDANSNDGYPVLNAALGVNTNSLDAASVKVYPTVFTSEFTISSNLALNSYQIYNLSGAFISSGKLDVNTTTVNAGNLSTGVYILNVRSAEGIISKRIIKK